MREVITGVITAVVLGALTLFWNWGTSGGLIRALGGVTRADIADTVKGQSLVPQVRPIHKVQKATEESRAQRVVQPPCLLERSLPLIGPTWASISVRQAGSHS